MRATTQSNYQLSLSTIAKLYIGLGRSVIPIHGDTLSNQAKVSAVSWKIFQKRLAPHQMIDYWFLNQQYGGLAIVTGRVSNLIVIDFDSQEREQEFQDQFPHLAKTRIIHSAGRGLSHYYYRLPHNINLPTLHMDGADLLSDGAYAIAPPTQINGRTYEVIEGGSEYQLTKYDAQHLLKFFNQCNGRYTQIDDNHNNFRNKEAELASLTTTIDITKNKPSSHIASPESLVHLYQHYAPQIGRNNALFKVACHGRDHQLSQLDVTNVLKIVHANQLSPHSQQPESHQARLREADKTIASVFSQPPKQPQPQVGRIQLTNSIREALLKQGLTCVARVLDALFLKGFKPGDVITKKLVTETLKDIVGRHSILKTFSTVLSNQPIFEKINPPPRTPTYTSVATDRLKESNKTCYLFSQSKPNKITVGRIPTHFCIPDLNVLCHLLNVPFTRSDPLTEVDICRAKTYRQGMHRELIKRRPGMYYRQWLASRLGVSKRTSQRYDSGADIQRQAMYIKEPVTWSNIDIIPTDEPISGRFIEGEDGKRYPPLRQIATRLLAQKQTISYCYQDANYYWYGDNLPIPTVQFGYNPKQPQFDTQLERLKSYIRGYWRDYKAKKHVKSIQSAIRPTRTKHVKITQHELSQHIYDRISEQYQPKSRRYYKTSLPDSRAEPLAQRLYQAIWDRATSDQSRLSLANARRLVDEYSEALILRGLSVLKYRQNINNPAGFITVWLRSTAKAMV